MGFKSYARFGHRIFSKRGSLPLYFVCFITNRCTAYCRHCLLGSSPSKTDELTLDEIEKVSRTMGNFLFFLPTGGEPFLRDDYPEIVKIFFKNNSVQNVGSATNGSLTDKVVDSVRRVLKGCPGIDYAIDVSIDAVGEKHDHIRRHPGIFEKAVYTYKELEKLKKEYPNFNLNIGVTVSKYNQDSLVELYDYLVNRLKVKNINQLLVRGNPREPDSKDVDMEKYSEFCDLIERDNRKRLIPGYSGYPFCDFINAIRIVRRKIIEKTVEQRRQQLPCYAANLAGVMLPNGDVYPCELRNERMGNVKDVDYDFRKIWFSKNAEDIRKKIKRERCFCTYECFLTVNTFFTPRIFPKVLKEYVNLKLHGNGGNGYGG